MAHARRIFGYAGLLLIFVWLGLMSAQGVAQYFYGKSPLVSLLSQLYGYAAIGVIAFLGVGIAIVFIRGFPLARKAQPPTPWWQPLVTYTYKVFLWAGIGFGVAALFVWAPKYFPNVDIDGLFLALFPAFLIVGIFGSVLFELWKRRRARSQKPDNDVRI